MPNCNPRSKLADDSSRWLHEYPAHRVRTWRLASGDWFSLRPVRHDDGALEEAHCLATNVAMLRLARSMDFSVNAEPADTAVLRIRRDLAAGNTQLH
jgi:hypothetical protein